MQLKANTGNHLLFFSCMLCFLFNSLYTSGQVVTNKAINRQCFAGHLQGLADTSSASLYHSIKSGNITAYHDSLLTIPWQPDSLDKAFTFCEWVSIANEFSCWGLDDTFICSPPDPSTLRILGIVSVENFNGPALALDHDGYTKDTARIYLPLVNMDSALCPEMEVLLALYFRFYEYESTYDEAGLQWLEDTLYKEFHTGLLLVPPHYSGTEDKAPADSKPILAPRAATEYISSPIATMVIPAVEMEVNIPPSPNVPAEPSPAQKLYLNSLLEYYYMNTLDW